MILLSYRFAKRWSVPKASGVYVIKDYLSAQAQIKELDADELEDHIYSRLKEELNYYISSSGYFSKIMDDIELQNAMNDPILPGSWAWAHLSHPKFLLPLVGAIMCTGLACQSPCERAFKALKTLTIGNRGATQFQTMDNRSRLFVHYSNKNMINTNKEEDMIAPSAEIRRFFSNIEEKTELLDEPEDEEHAENSTLLLNQNAEYESGGLSGERYCFNM